jgi:hypothetical protein
MATPFEVVAILVSCKDASFAVMTSEVVSVMLPITISLCPDWGRLRYINWTIIRESKKEDP